MEIEEEKQDPTKTTKPNESTNHDKIYKDINQEFDYLEKGLINNEDRLISRSLRSIFSKRPFFTRYAIEDIVQIRLQNSNPKKRKLLQYLSNVPMDFNVSAGELFDHALKKQQRQKRLAAKKKAAATPIAPVSASDVFQQTPSQEPTSTPAKPTSAPAPAPKQEKEQPAYTVQVLPEVEHLLQLLVVVILLDSAQIQIALEAATGMMNELDSSSANLLSRRTMNQLAAKIFFFFSRIHEKNGTWDSVRPLLLKHLRTAYLRKDEYSAVVLVNVLCRNYLSANQYEQAEKLLEQSPITKFHSNAQLARYSYFKAKILAIGLQYHDAHHWSTKVLQKMPSAGAHAFRLCATKLSIVVRLLLGEIPQRALFFQKGMKGALKPYFELARQVRIGNLQGFTKVCETFGGVFRQDNLFSLVVRIRQNVIRIGLKKIAKAYSRISLKDIAQKLELEEYEDVHWIVAKAIGDGIISARIDPENSFLETQSAIDIYATDAPSLFFKERISYCRNLQEETVKAMRFKEKKKEKKGEESEEMEDIESQLEEFLEDLDGDEDDEFDEM